VFIKFEGNKTIKGLGDLEVVSFNKEIPQKKYLF
jgi:hypothetical protein